MPDLMAQHTYSLLKQRSLERVIQHPVVQKTVAQKTVAQDLALAS
jgi:hypothetical protein